MSKEVKLDEMLKFTKEINESQGVISKDVFQAVKNSTKDNTQYDRSITKIEQDTYDAAKGILDETRKDVDLTTDAGINAMKATFQNIAKQVKHEDQIGVVAKAIADTLAPVDKTEIDKKLAQIDAEHSGLYSETTKEILKEKLINSPEYQKNDLQEGVNRALTTIADVAVEKSYRGTIEEKLRAELGIQAGSKVQNNVQVPDSPVVKKDNEIPDRKADSDIKSFDVARTRELNASENRSSRLKSVRSRLGSKTSGYFPYSGLKFEMNATSSMLEKEELYTELEKLYNSNGLRNMSKFITEASKHLKLVIGDIDKGITNPGDALRGKLHAYDFKYLLLYKAISVGETSVEGESNCPKCSGLVNFKVDLLELLKGWSQEQYRSFDNYDASKKYTELTQDWRSIKHVDTFSRGDFDTEDGLIYDEIFKASYNKVFYTISYNEPTIEKYMNIKNNAFAIMIHYFKDSIPSNLRDEDAIMDHINNAFGERVVRLQTIIESLVVIDTIKVSYVYENPKTPEELGLVVGEDIITIADLDAPKTYALINDELDPVVLEMARDYLIKNYDLENRAKQVELNKGYTLEDIAGQELAIPTLLEDIIFLDVHGIDCPHCKHKFAAEVSSLWLGFELIQKSIKKMKS